MKKRRKTERIYIYIRIPANRGTRWFDRFLPLRFESSLPAKGDPGTNEKPPSPRCRFSSPRIDRAGERSSGTPKEESRCKTWLRSNTIPPLPPRAKLPTVFPPEASQIILETRSFDFDSFAAHLSFHRFVRACVRASVGGPDGGAAPANLAQPRISMRTLPATYLWTSAVTFEKGSRRYESSRNILD